MIESFNSSGESKDSNKDTETKKDSKPSVNKKKIGNFTAKNVVDAPSFHRPKSEKPAEKPSIWEEILGKNAGHTKEINGEANGDKSESGSKKATKGESESTKDEAEIERIQPEEQLEIARRLAEGRQAEVRGHLAEGEADELVSVEDAASLALLEAVQKKLDENPAATVDETLAEAEAETIEKIEADIELEIEQSEHEHPETDLASEDGVGFTEGEILLHADPGVTEENTPVVIPLSGSGSGASGSAQSQGGGGSGGGTTPPPAGGGSGGAGGGGGSVPPRNPGGGFTPPAAGGGGVPMPNFNAGPNINAAPATAVQAPGVSLEDHQRIVHRQERAAIAQGLLIGGIVGYLIGRRRGRIKTEKRLLPVQKKLESQVENLQNTLFEREQKIRSIAVEKAKEMANAEARERFARRLAHEDTFRAKAAERQKAANHETPRTYRLGQVIVEAPAVILSGALAARRAELGIEKPQIAAFPDKKIENYSGPELKQAAEKIRVDGTSLKEMWDRGQLSEKSVERVIAQFMEGKSVRAALNREMLSEEARFEIDPKLRDSVKHNPPLSGAMGGKSEAAIAGAALLLRKLDNKNSARSDGHDAESRKDSSAKSKQPTTLQKAVKDPTIQLAAGGVIAAVLFIMAVLIFA